MNVITRNMVEDGIKSGIIHINKTDDPLLMPCEIGDGAFFVDISGCPDVFVPTLQEIVDAITGEFDSYAMAMQDENEYGYYYDCLSHNLNHVFVVIDDNEGVVAICDSPYNADKAFETWVQRMYDGNEENTRIEIRKMNRVYY